MNGRLLLLPSALALAACSGHFKDLDYHRLDYSTQGWVKWTQAGNKQAQFEPGLRFARGESVPQDCEKARKLSLLPVNLPSSSTACTACGSMVLHSNGMIRR